MFQGNRVQACSVPVKDNSIYFTGIAGAAMKNKESQWMQKVLHQGKGLPVSPWKFRVLQHSVKCQVTKIMLEVY